MTSVMGFVAWFGIALSHWRFRRAFVLQNYSLNDLVYKALFFPVGPILATLLICFCVFGQGYSSFKTTVVNCTNPDNVTLFNDQNYLFLFEQNNSTKCYEHSFSLSQFLSGYVILPIFAIMYFIYKFVNKTRIIPLAEIDLVSDSVIHRQNKETIIE